jgi:hypothetical protein
MWSREEKNAYQREYRKRTHNACTHRYEKTIKGFLMRKYRNMLSRVRGIQKNKAHLYFGKYILPKKMFYQWSLKNKDFRRLWSLWVKNGYSRRLCPSIDRIDSSIGYHLFNMRWVTQSENSMRVRENKK